MPVTYSKQDLPVFEFGVVDLRNTVGDETANTLLESVHRVKGADDKCLFFSCVPHC